MKKFVLALMCSQLLLPALAARAADDPMALLKAATSTLRKAHSVSASYVTRREYPPKPGGTKRRKMYDVGSIECQLPNLSHETIWFTKSADVQPPDPPTMRMITTTTARYIIDGSTYTEQTNSKNGDGAFTEAPLSGFFNALGSVASQVDGYRKRHKLHFLRMDPDEQWQGATYKVVEFEYVDDDLQGFLSSDDKKTLPGGLAVTTQKNYIGSDGLIYRIVDHENLDWDQDYSISDLKLNPVIAAAEFTLPAGCTPQSPPSPLLANGTAAPDFTVQNAKGAAVHLSDYLGKVVVLDFWATWCGPCQEALPGLQVIAAKYQGNNVVTLAVNVWDTKDAFNAWLPDHTKLSALTFLINTSSQGQDVATKLYKVSGIPTQYVIDKQGKIVASFVGYSSDETHLEAAIKGVM